MPSISKIFRLHADRIQTHRSLGTCRQDASPSRCWPRSNLFRNPFGELTRAERAELAVVDLEPILAAITQRPSCGPAQFLPRTAVQWVGDCGRGKTTRMLAIQRAFPTACYVYLPEDQPCPSIPQGEPLLIDEAQRLPRRVRKDLLATGVTLVLATHRDLTRPLRRAGYQVFTQRIGLTLGPSELAEMLNRRILASRRDPQLPVPRISLRDAAELIRRFGTDVRAIEGYLYDTVQSQVNDHGEMRFID
ncbi:hypothetical protein FYK55_14625 [Roseiconus nitratireducens]|uniref:TniB protein n=1 Tax=Roseiconus nitratireducens TaxID=2605748 RepID=A0A5M6D8W8_9BACT|nr:hypothetical protein [Roseiconus nitratireducens]KAA5542752.1 hypothetical protein FYK55_14625 [Roseiconus nitratireducens]